MINLQVCFVDISPTLSVSGLCKFTFRQVPWRSQELYFAERLIKHRFILFYLASEQCAVRLIQAT